jgi:hypothetical protein
MADKKITQSELIMEYFIKNSNKNISHPEIVDWLTSEFYKRTGTVFRDPDRGIRKLAQSGQLIKISKGVYHYDPDFVVNRKLEDFTPEQKKIILKRDEYKCVVCGLGVGDGVDLQIDHIKPKDLGGKATIENGQVLCAQHNFRKKNLGQTETGKKMFIRLYELAKKIDDEDTMNFCAEILEVFEKNGMNGHIVWNK